MAEVNTLPMRAYARRPRGAVRIGGTVIEGWREWEVDSNSARSADTFRVTFALALLPKERDANWFSAQKIVDVEIFATHEVGHDGPYSPSNDDLVIKGEVDEMNLDPVAGTLELHGRDLTLRLIDTKSSEYFENKTASEIATTLANRHGLKPVVTSTSKKVGGYYQNEHISLSHQQSEWELMTYLANVEDMALYVRGDELHFEPRKPSSDSVYVIGWQLPNDDAAHPVGNVISLQFTRALHIAKGVSVEVRSWKQDAKTAFVEVFPKSGKTVQPGQSGARTVVYRRTIAGKTKEQAQALAQSLYQQIVAHEMRMNAELPGDSLLQCDMKVQVRGTQTQFDQVYYPESIVRSMSAGEGYRMRLRAINASRDLEMMDV